MRRGFYFPLLFWAALSSGTLFIHRFFFVALFRTDEPLADVLNHYLLGLRFDLATLPVLLLPFSVVFPFAFMAKSKQAIAIRTLFYAQANWLVILNLVLTASSFNYSVNSKHLGWEFFAYLSDVATILHGVFDQSAHLAVPFLLAWPTFAVVLFFIVKKAQIRTDTRLSWLELAIYELLILVFSVILLRGGIQQSPLRTADAMTSTNAYLSNAALNGVFTILHDATDLADFQTYYTEKENTLFVHRALGQPEDFFSERYPLLRYMPPRSTRQPASSPNIILFILESVTGKFLAQHGGNPAITPNLNRLADGGIFFDRFYASGGRSANGLFSMLAGLPDRAGRTILRSAQIQNRFGGLAYLLGQKSYNTVFVHGGDLSFDNLYSALPHLGFAEYFGQTELIKAGYSDAVAWGINDEDSMNFLLRWIDAKQTNPGQPFFAALFTLNTHHPFTIPDQPEHKVFGSEVPEHAFLNALHYTDYSLGAFMAKAQSKPWFANTVFLFVADHAHHTGLSYLEDRTIPFLIYNPRFFPPQRRRDVAGQLDVLPTILGLAGGDSLYASIGRDLLAPLEPRKEFAFFAGGSNTDLIGCIRKDRLMLKWLSNPKPVLLSALPPGEEKDLTPAEPAMAEELLQLSQHFHQMTRQLEKANRIWPDRKEEGYLKPKR